MTDNLETDHRILDVAWDDFMERYGILEDNGKQSEWFMDLVHKGVTPAEISQIFDKAYQAWTNNGTVFPATWKGLLAFLDEKYPADIFTGESGDPGPVIVKLSREVGELKRKLEELKNEVQGQASMGRPGGQLEWVVRELERILR